MKHLLLLAVFKLLLLFPNLLFAQVSVKEIIEKDSLFWSAYNTCDLNLMNQFISDDIEFYHDQNGVLTGKSVYLEIFEKYLCGNKDFRLRRVPVKDKVSVSILKGGESIYGAVITGEHRFYISEPGKEERLAEAAKFMTLWLLKEGSLKMARVISYDHQNARM